MSLPGQLYNILSWPATSAILIAQKPRNYLPAVVCVTSSYLVATNYPGSNNFVMATAAFLAGGIAYVALEKIQGE